MAASFYATRSLGKEWLPSPVCEAQFTDNNSLDAAWSTLRSPKLRSSSRYEAPKTWKSRGNSKYSCWRKWTRSYERIILASLVIMILWTFHGNLQQRISNLQSNLHALVHSSSPSDERLQAPDSTWSQFAYHFHAHDPSTLCSALTHLQTLERLDSKPTRLLTYPAPWTTSSAPLQKNILRLLQRADEDFHAILQPIAIPALPPPPSSSSSSSSSSSDQASNSATASEYAKFLPFNQTQYTRIAHFHPSSTILSPSLDEIFLFSAADIAMPRQYWKTENSESNSLSDSLLLIKPDGLLFERLVHLFTAPDSFEAEGEISEATPSRKTFMSTLVRLVEEATFLPHKTYLLRDAEFWISGGHAGYLGKEGGEVWDPLRVIDEAKLVVFDDDEEEEEREGRRRGDSPDCEGRSGEMRTAGGAETCAEREIWKWLVRDRRDRRTAICGLELAGEVGERLVNESEEAKID
ncbi:glycosyltransferase family 8 protein [Cercospora zeae-maydis SCOH1-5]|uniref:Glycosyltransferase family 8 protein n=1 Tax=Cercospora zeae-maydis SCOH1-5 TaxID=717836 RepID=A0A6A6FUI5_9PEZI|nr:glycosyltransferase family 8 protein [Cercospora zeae-maydis SCOH1-5]